MSASLPSTRAATRGFRRLEGALAACRKASEASRTKLPGVKRALPLWLLAALPATLVGHWLAYIGVGRSLADGRHGYALPSFEISALVLGVLCAGLLVGALVQAGIVDRIRLEATGWSLWLKLAPIQVVLFAIIERLEGYAPSLAGCLIQCVLAAAVAALLALFARFFSRCVLESQEASAYLQRLLSSPFHAHLRRAPFAVAFALSASVGPIRFGRPPPHP